jgi:ABC-type nitrate/sulfonate/bicarbonate transport system permease component
MSSASRWKGLAVPLALLVAAEAAMRINMTQSDTLARPVEIAQATWESLADGSIVRATAQTLGAALGGLALGSGLGLAIGVWLGLSRAAARLCTLSIEMVRPVPSVALIPLAMLVFGFGYRMEILIIAFACLWPMLILTQAAVGNIEPRLLEVAQLLGLPRVQQVWKVVLPAALPRIFVAFRLAAGVALVVAVTIEIAANPYGLGHGMMIAQQTLQPALMFALLLWVGMIGWSLNAGLLALQRRWFGTMAPEAIP